jgi:serine/threonine protein kinase
MHFAHKLRVIRASDRNRCAIKILPMSRRYHQSTPTTSGGMTNSFASGAVVDDKFVVRRKIGQGAAGEVYLAHQLPAGPLVALKVLRAELTTSPVMTEALLEEARFLASVEHQYIVRVHAVGQHDGNKVLYCSGIC